MSILLARVGLKSPVLLAPLAGITDLPFRNLVSGFGAGLVVSEMVASQEMVQAKPGTRERAELGADIENTSVQLAGRDAYWMSEAARMVADNGARIIDINMGCPAKKVVNGYSGSALLKDIDHAMTLIDAVIAAVDVPVTLKTRLGWDQNLMTAPDLAKRAENSGISMVTIHGRTRCQFYRGQANWQAIAAVKDAVKIPVIANGDITDCSHTVNALSQSGADGVMIGRGVQGRPWLLAQIAAHLDGTSAPSTPTGPDLAEIIVRHYEAMLGFYGIVLGLRVARKHLGWYMDQADIGHGIRRMVLTSEDPSHVITEIRRAFSSAQAVAA